MPQVAGEGSFLFPIGICGAGHIIAEEGTKVYELTPEVISQLSSNSTNYQKKSLLFFVIRDHHINYFLVTVSNMQAATDLFRDDTVTLHHAIAVHLLHRHVAAIGNAVRTRSRPRSFATPHSPRASCSSCMITQSRGEDNVGLMDIPLWEVELVRSRCRGARGRLRKGSLSGRLGPSSAGGSCGVLVVFEDTVAFAGDGRFGLRIR